MTESSWPSKRATRRSEPEVRFWTLTREEVMAKARGLMTPVLGAPLFAKLIEATLAIESLRNVRELRPLLQRG